MAKQIPYGLTDFVRIRTDNYYYVDKSHYIELIERMPSFLFLIRPRRFGKSLFLSLLRCYYDTGYSARFDELFKDLYIGKHPTREQGKYLILYFNFSMIRGTGEKLEDEFNRYIGQMTTAFAERYASFFPENFRERLAQFDTAGRQLTYIDLCARPLGLSIYLLIDEYDNFTNTILSSEGNNVYRSLTHDTGFYRGFFNVVKGLTTDAEASVKRMFITGVSPVTLDDVTSGFNIGTNITTDEQFNNMVGFSEEELREMLAYYKKEGQVPDSIDEVVAMMKPWYDNYCFATECIGTTMYNSDMALYFLNTYLMKGVAPKEMIDRNIRTDYSKLRHFIRIDRMQKEGCSVITELMEKGEINGNIIKDSFPADKLADAGNFTSLLYYFGMITFDRIQRGKCIMKVPNLAVREQIYGYLAETMRENGGIDFPYMELSELMYAMAYDGEWEPVLRFFAEQINQKTVLRDAIYQEATIKTLMLSYLSMSDYFIVWPEFEAGKGFSDLYLMPRLGRYPDMQYAYLIELKYLKRDDTTTSVDKLVADARRQLQQYAADEKVQQSVGNTRLRKLVAVYKGWEPAVLEELT